MSEPDFHYHVHVACVLSLSHSHSFLFGRVCLFNISRISTINKRCRHRRRSTTIGNVSFSSFVVVCGNEEQHRGRGDGTKDTRIQCNRKVSVKSLKFLNIDKIQKSKIDKQIGRRHDTAQRTVNKIINLLFAFSESYTQAEQSFAATELLNLVFGTRTCNKNLQFSPNRCELWLSRQNDEN